MIGSRVLKERSGRIVSLPLTNLGLDSLQHLWFRFDGERFRLALLDDQGADAFERNFLEVADVPHLTSPIVRHRLLHGRFGDARDDRTVLLGGVVIVPALHDLAAGNLGEDDSADPQIDIRTVGLVRCRRG